MRPGSYWFSINALGEIKSNVCILRVFILILLRNMWKISEKVLVFTHKDESLDI